MSNRPKIPAEIARAVFIESGHRCAVCGTPFPLERGHIVPWHVTTEHLAENLICLCANCHERADRESWGEKTLRKYKDLPWVHRQYRNDSGVDSTSEVEITIRMELENFDEKWRSWLKHGLAGFLRIRPSSVEIRSIEEGSVKVTVAVPNEHAEKLVSGFHGSDPELREFVSPLVLDGVRRKSGSNDTDQQAELQVKLVIPAPLSFDAVFDALRRNDLSEPQKHRLIKHEIESTCRMFMHRIEEMLRIERTRAEANIRLARLETSVRQNEAMLRIREEFVRTMAGLGHKVELEELEFLAGFGEQLLHFERELETSNIDEDLKARIRQAQESAWSRTVERLTEFTETVITSTHKSTTDRGTAP